MTGNGELKRFITKLEWKIESKELEQITCFEYSCFKFKFKINGYENEKRFCEFLKSQSDEILLPWDICNYLLSQKIDFKINFRICSGVGFKTNYDLFKTVIYLKWQYYKIRFKEKYSFRLILNKKEINGKIRPNFMFQVYKHKSDTVFFVQADTNVWLLPKHIVKKNDTFTMNSFGWLFAQIGIGKKKQ